jgi:hypothetical protein
MIQFLAYSVPFLLLAVVAYALSGRLSRMTRLSVALAVWLVPSAVLTLWVAHVGDPPPTQSTIVK